MTCIINNQLHDHFDREEHEEHMSQIKDDIVTALIQGANYYYDGEYNAQTFYAESVIDEMQSELDSEEFSQLLFGLSRGDEESITRFNELLLEHAEKLVEIQFKG